MGLRSASPAYDVLRVVLLGAATGIVLVHLNRAWSGAGADAGPAAGAAGAGAADRRGDYKYTDKYTSDAVNDVAIRRPSPPSPALPPPPAPPAKPPPAPPAPPIIDREYRTPWGYFDPQAVFGFAPLTLASLPRRFDVGTIPGIEFNPSLARLPPGIAAMLSSELGLREGTPGPVYESFPTSTSFWTLSHAYISAATTHAPP